MDMSGVTYESVLGKSSISVSTLFMVASESTARGGMMCTVAVSDF